MNAAILAFTLKGQDWELIRSSIERVSWICDTESSDKPTILIHGFMPRKVLIEKQYPTNVVDAIDEQFPIQLNMYSNNPLRSEMVEIGKKLGAKVYIIGEVREGVAEEEALYKEAGLEIIHIPLTKENTGQ